MLIELVLSDTAVHEGSLSDLHDVHTVRMSLCANFPFLQDTRHIGLGPTLMSSL